MRGALEIVEYFKSGKSHPDEIFQIYEELLNLPEKEVEYAIKKYGIGDSIEMSYISAIEMKKNGKWDSYIEEWNKKKHKTGMDRLEEYMKENGLKNMLKV